MRGRPSAPRRHMLGRGGFLAGALGVAAVLGPVGGPVQGSGQGVPETGGTVLGADLRLDVTIRGVTVVLDYRLDVAPGVRAIPVEAPPFDVGYAYDVDAEFEGTGADVVPGPGGSPRTWTVQIPEVFGSEGGEALLALRYRIATAVEIDESRVITARFPIVEVPWEHGGPESGAFLGVMRLPPGIELDEASPGGWERDEGITSRLRYRRPFDALPEVVEVRASEMHFGRRGERAVGLTALLAGFLIVGLVAGLIGWRMLRRPRAGG